MTPVSIRTKLWNATLTWKDPERKREITLWSIVYARGIPTSSADFHKQSATTISSQCR